MEPHTGLNNLDYIVLGILALSGILALFRGFVREMFSLGVWAAAYYIAAKYHPLAEPWVQHYIRNKEITPTVSAVAMFCGSFILLTIVTAIIARLIIRGRALTAIDRSLGFVFGLMRGALIICIVYFAAASILWPNMDKPPGERALAEEPNKDKDHSEPPQWLLEAKMRPAMAYGTKLLKAFIPEDEVKKTTQSTQQYIQDEFAKQKAEAEKAIEQKQLDMMSTPVASGGKDIPAPTYDDKSRSSFDQFINQKAKQ